MRAVVAVLFVRCVVLLHLLRAGCTLNLADRGCDRRGDEQKAECESRYHGPVENLWGEYHISTCEGELMTASCHCEAGMPAATLGSRIDDLRTDCTALGLHHLVSEPVVE